MTTTPLTLQELKTRQASLEELQSTLIAFIELYNEQTIATQNALNEKAPRTVRFGL